MFIFARPLRAVAAGLAVALLIVYADRCCSNPRLVLRPPPAVSCAPVRDRSLSCRLPPASLLASWLPSLKSRIVLDQVAVCAPANQPIFGMHSC
jgi:hypothetical protein